jgi:coatomer subunit epsilon
MKGADHAEKQLRVMQQLDEDHTLTQLATRIPHGFSKHVSDFLKNLRNYLQMFFQGVSKIQEAHLIFQDLTDMYPTTRTVLNGKALC